jgi:FKBP-type peptidyl-prolyl cis-trans isomerase 2
MKIGDFVSINYVGRVKDTGEIFDTTIEETARKEGVYDPRTIYRPVNVVVGANFVIRGLEDALKNMEVGERKTIIIDPKDGFGERNPEYIRPIPLSNFKNERIDPTPGSWITINGIRGRILSANGGRIRVDFNHPLAGKKLEYDLHIVNLIEGQEEQIKSIVSYITGLEHEKIHASVKSKEAEISIDVKRDLPAQMKKRVADLIIKWVHGVEKVRFVDEYSADGNEAQQEASGTGK